MQRPFIELIEDAVMLIFLLFLAVGLIELALLLFCCRLAENRQKMKSARMEKRNKPS
jgi:hypothetical protein